MKRVIILTLAIAVSIDTTYAQNNKLSYNTFKT